MFRCLGVAVAGLVLSALSGCTVDSFLSPVAFVSSGPKTVAAGTMSQVTAKLQDGLTDAGMTMYPVKRVGKEVRLAGITKSQLVFCLHLSAAKEAPGKKTLVRMKWDMGGDKELWETVVKILATPTTSGEDSADDTTDTSTSPLSRRQ